MRPPSSAHGLALATLLAWSAHSHGGTAQPGRIQHARQAVDAWAKAQAQRLAGEREQAAQGYAQAVALCHRAFARPRDVSWGPVFLEVFLRARDQQKRLASQPTGDVQRTPPRLFLKRLALLKARGDRLASEGDVVRARLTYEAVLRAGELLRERFPGSDASKAASWSSGRAEQAIGRLSTAAPPSTPRATLEQTLRDVLAGGDPSMPKTPSGTIELDVAALGLPPPLASMLGLSPLVVATARHATAGSLRWPIGTSIGLRSTLLSSLAPLSGAATRRALGAVRDSLGPHGGLLPDPAGQQPGETQSAALASARRSLPPRVGFPAAFLAVDPDRAMADAWQVTVRSVVADLVRNDVAMAPEEGLSFLRWLLANDISAATVGELAQALSRRTVVAPGGGITMGAKRPADQDFRPVALDACLAVLQVAPERDQDGRITDRAFGLATELARLPEIERLLRRRLDDARPGLLGVLLFKVLRGQHRDDEAYELLARMGERPERFLPATRGTAELLRHGFEHYVSSGELAAAEALLGAFEACQLADEGDRWLDVARAHQRDARAGLARRAAAKALAKSTSESAKAQAKSLLDLLGGRPRQQPRRATTADELAVLAEQARVDPRLYPRLALEYRRAGMYPEAREAYKVAARRFDDLAAGRALVDTYFEEGKGAEGVRHATAFVADHLASRPAQELAGLASRWCVARDRQADWARLCLGIAKAGRDGLPERYIHELVHFLAKARRGAIDPPSTLLAAVERHARAATAWPRIETRIREKEQALVRLIAPWTTAAHPVSLADALPLYAPRIAIAPLAAAVTESAARPLDLGEALRPWATAFTVGVSPAPLPDVRDEGAGKRGKQ